MWLKNVHLSADGIWVNEIYSSQNTNYITSFLCWESFNGFYLTLELALTWPPKPNIWPTPLMLSPTVLHLHELSTLSSKTDQHLGLCICSSSSSNDWLFLTTQVSTQMSPLERCLLPNLHHSTPFLCSTFIVTSLIEAIIYLLIISLPHPYH